MGRRREGSDSGRQPGTLVLAWNRACMLLLSGIFNLHGKPSVMIRPNLRAARINARFVLANQRAIAWISRSIEAGTRQSAIPRHKQSFYKPSRIPMMLIAGEIQGYETNRRYPKRQKLRKDRRFIAIAPSFTRRRFGSHVDHCHTQSQLASRHFHLWFCYKCIRSIFESMIPVKAIRDSCAILDFLSNSSIKKKKRQFTSRYASIFNKTERIAVLVNTDVTELMRWWKTMFLYCTIFSNFCQVCFIHVREKEN